MYIKCFTVLYFCWGFFIFYFIEGGLEKKHVESLSVSFEEFSGFRKFIIKNDCTHFNGCQLIHRFAGPACTILPDWSTTWLTRLLVVIRQSLSENWANNTGWPIGKITVLLTDTIFIYIICSIWMSSMCCFSFKCIPWVIWNINKYMFELYVWNALFVYGGLWGHPIHFILTKIVQQQMGEIK